MTGPELKKLRESVLLSQCALARMLGVSNSLIWCYENKKTPISSTMAERIKGAIQETSENPALARRIRKKPEANPEKKEPVENDISKSTDRPVISTESTHRPLPDLPRTITVELSPESIRRLGQIILDGIRAMREEPVAIKPEVIQAAREGDRYRARAQEILNGRGY